MEKKLELLTEWLDKDPASCAKIELDDKLDFCDYFDESLATIISKLRHGGTISLVGSDLTEISRGLTTGHLELPKALTLLYGGRHSISTLSAIVEKLQGHGLKVMQKRCNDYKYYVVATRP